MKVSKAQKPQRYVYARCMCRVPLGSDGYSNDPAVVEAQWCHGCSNTARIGYGN